MNIRVLSKADKAIDSLAFHRVIALLRIRSRSWTKTGAYSFICTAPCRGKSLMVFLDLLKVSIVSELNSPCSALCIEALESTTQTNDLLCLWHLCRRMKRECLRLWACIFPRQIPCYFAGTICLSWGFFRCFFSKLGAQGFRSRVSLFRIMPPDCLFLSRIQSCTRCILRIPWCVPPKRSIPILQLSEEYNSRIWFLRYTTLDFFFPQNSNLSLSTFFFSTSRWFSLSPFSMS